MLTRILCSSYLLDFESSFPEIDFLVKKEADKLAAQVHSKKLDEWEVCFQFWFNNVRNVLIYTKGRSFTVERYKDIIVHIPMPTKEKAAWGVDISQHIYKEDNHLNELTKNFHILDIDYDKFNTRNDYSTDCMLRAICFCFTNGFTINKISVKVKGVKQ